MATKILIRRDTAANWTAENPVLSEGEIGYDLTNKKLKIGDGSTDWNSLEYYQGDDALEIVYDNSSSGLSASTVQTAIDEIEGRVDTNETDISSAESRLDTIEGDASTEGSIAKAEADAITSANSYTDTRENAITSAYESYADQAEADAKAYTDTRESAITSAYESYADQAEADAITSANSYTDTQIDAAKLALGTNYSVADITARDALEDLTVGDLIFVTDDGDAKWAQYKVTAITDGLGSTSTFEKIMDEDVYLNAVSASAIKSSYESNADTNAFTDALKTRLEEVGTNYLVSTIAEAEALPNLLIGDVVYIDDIGTGKWGEYLVIDNTQQDYTFSLITSETIIDNAISESAIKTAYESNTDTNAFTDALLSKLNAIEENAKDDQNAGEVDYNNTSSGLSATNAQTAIDELNTHIENHTNDNTIHFTQAEISITENQISDFGNYEPADGTILKSADIGVSVQAYDSNYVTFNPDGTYNNLRAQATTAEDVGLGNVTNESKTTMFTDAALTGVPIAPTAAGSTNTTQIATTAFVQQELATIDGGDFN